MYISETINIVTYMCILLKIHFTVSYNHRLPKDQAARYIFRLNQSFEEWLGGAASEGAHHTPILDGLKDGSEGAQHAPRPEGGLD